MPYNLYTGVNGMDQKIYELLVEMNKDIKELNKHFDNLENKVVNLEKSFANLDSKVDKGFKETNQKLDRIEAKLEGAGYQFEQTNENRIDDVSFLINKVNKLEYELFRMKNQ